MAIVAEVKIAQHNQIKIIIPHGQLYWVREAIIKKNNSLNTGITRKGGGVQPLPKSFWSTFFNEPNIWAKLRRGGGNGLAKLFVEL